MRQLSVCKLATLDSELFLGVLPNPNLVSRGGLFARRR
jgi:hypothetical protein